MKSYFAILLFLGIGTSIVAGSLILLLWINSRYPADSFESRVAKIALVWLDCLISLASSYFPISSLSQDIQQHPLVATALIAATVCVITARAYAQRRYLPVVCVSLIAPLALWGIWCSNQVNNFLRCLGIPLFLLTGSVIYVLITCLCIQTAKAKDATSKRRTPPMPPYHPATTESPDRS